MNVNDPYIIAALPHWTGEPSTLDIEWRAADMREADRDRAVIARIGGNEYRTRLTIGRTQPADLDRYARQDAEAQAANREYRRGRYSDVFKWTDTEGNPGLTPALYMGFDYIASPRSFVVTLPEAAFSWPIYRAGYTQSTEDCESCGHVEFAYGPPPEDD